MAKNEKGREQPRRVLISKAFEGDEAPGQLSVAIVSLVELCNLAMPDTAKLRSEILGAGFSAAPKDVTERTGAWLSLEDKVAASPVRNLRHEMFGRDRHGENVYIVLSEGNSADGKVVFCSTVFTGAIEADAVKAAAHVAKKEPFIGSTHRRPDGRVLRRVFWDVEGVAGIRGLVVSGPENVELLNEPRAFTAFNKVAAKRR